MPVWNIAWDEIKKGDEIVDTLKQYGETLKEQTSGKLSYKIDFDINSTGGIRYMFNICIADSYHNVRLVDVEYNMMNGNMSFTYFGNNSRQDKSGSARPRKIGKCIERYMDKVVTKKETSGLIRLLLMHYDRIEQERKIEKDKQNQNIKNENTV